jgi:filamentous hemagglutinin family protein
MRLNPCLLALSLFLSFPVNTNNAVGQVTPDGSLPTRIDARSNYTEITGGTSAGNNLFHSFQEFSIPTDGVVLFNNALTVNNIINRVTGKSISNIDGTLRANGTANIFLINPNGIIFGPNARLNIGGSFLATTANSLRFADGQEFSATTTNTSLLSVSVPIGLQFGLNPQAIINQASNQQRRLPNVVPIGLQVPFGETIALIGGDVHLQGGNLTAYGGRIEIGSVGDRSFVALIQDDQGWQLGYRAVRRFQNITLSKEASLDASGPDGTIALKGQDITLRGGSQLLISTTGLDNAGNLTDGSLDSGNLTINASGSVTLINSDRLTNDIATSIFVQVDPGARGNSGNIEINTARLRLEDGATISVGTTGQGKGGTLTINASQSVEIFGVGVASSLLTASTGPSAILDPEGVKDRFSQGQLGDAGNITINTRSLTLANGGQIQAVSGGGTFSLKDSQGNPIIIEAFGGKSGNITLNATESILITGTGKVSGFTPSNPDDSVDIPSRIITSTGISEFKLSGSQNAGSIQVNTSQLTVSNQGQITVDSFSLDSLVEAGNLSVHAGSILLDNNARLFANSVAGAGGNISLTATNSLTIHQNSLISASAGNNGDGGNISINTPFIFAVPLENSDISANAEQGRGGNVSISAAGIFGIEFRPQPTILSDITVSSQFAQSGTFTLNGLDVNPQNELINAPTQVIDTESLIARTCGTGGALNRGEFTITGRGGLPTDPSQVLELGEGLPDFGQRQGNSRVNTVSIPALMSNPAPETIIEAQGWIISNNGQIILTDRVPNTTPHQTGFAAVNCYLGDQRS